ncbi:MAG: DUF1080 domain-containing protein [Planctomycetaceae bacterium]|jgi:hypothetical protein|nr:DUF1080 domain-containing protein [Planctomycetaceae bacterium]
MTAFTCRVIPLSAVFCLLFNANTIDGQILLTPPAESVPVPAGTPQTGIIVGGGSSFAAPPAMYGVPDNTAGAAETTPYPGTGTYLYGQPQPKANPGLPAYSPSYSAPSGSSFRIRPGMTREEIVRAMAEERRMKNIEQEEQQDKMWQNFRVKKEIQKSVASLFQETESFRPKQLTKDSVPQTLETTAELLKETPKVPDTVKRDAPVLSEDERIAQEVKAKREALEKLEDSEQKQKDLEALKRREEARQRWQQQRAEAERGANLFEIPPSLRLKDQALKDGWCLLFDGKTLFGWRSQQEGPYAGGQFTAEDGETLCSNPEHPGLLYTTAQFGDCTVMFEYQAEKDAEAFLLLRTPPNPKNLHTSCYTIVLNSADPSRPRGSIPGRLQVNETQIVNARRRRENEDPNEWHRLKAQFDANRLQITVDNDEPANLLDVKPLGYGYIGLLVTKGTVRFRMMLWKPGSEASLFDGVSYDNSWRTHGKAMKVAVLNSALQLAGGQGVLETRSTFGNFVFQGEYSIAYTSGKGNVFLRSHPREPQTGYTVSLQNFPTRQDRNGGKGVDAGAFSGVKNARYTRPQDQKWNYLTIAAAGRQFQTWVNGVPVCEMTDKEGRFTEGTIQLTLPQDDGNVQFRNLRISPYPPRMEKTKTMEDWEKTTYEAQRAERKRKEEEKELDEKK